MAELGNISERRVAQLIMGLRGLPEFLVANPGLNSGFMIPQYAAASMVSQNKMYCYHRPHHNLQPPPKQDPTGGGGAPPPPHATK